MSIIYAPSVEEYLVELSEILFAKEYFGFVEDAKDYVSEIIIDIDRSLHRKLKKDAPRYFDRYGENLSYSVFKKNNNTQWYVFFNYEDDVYMIRYIGNNHTCSDICNFGK